MRVLYIGGTGNISRACVEESLRKGMDVTVYQRGKSPTPVPPGARSLVGDYADRAATKRILGNERFDVVAQFIAYTQDQVEFDVGLLGKRCGQYIFISSASAYHKPPSTVPVTESTPLFNPYWKYSRDKIACEELLGRAYRDQGFPATIVRPSHTYSTGWIPTTFGSRDYTVAKRILDGRPIVVHGDGTSLWTLTHADDFARAFVGLLGNPRAVGETFHITSDEALSWDQIHRILGSALGREPVILHLASDLIAARYPDRGAGLLGDKAHCMVFDNSKIRAFVPGYRATIPYHEGVRRSLEWLDKDPARKILMPEVDREIDALVALHGRIGELS